MPSITSKIGPFFNYFLNSMWRPTPLSVASEKKYPKHGAEPTTTHASSAMFQAFCHVWQYKQQGPLRRPKEIMPRQNEEMIL